MEAAGWRLLRNGASSLPPSLLGPPFEEGSTFAVKKARNACTAPLRNNTVHWEGRPARYVSAWFRRIILLRLPCPCPDGDCDCR